MYTFYSLLASQNLSSYCNVNSSYHTCSVNFFDSLHSAKEPFFLKHLFQRFLIYLENAVISHCNAPDHTAPTALGKGISLRTSVSARREL